MKWTRIAGHAGTILGGLITSGCAFLYNMDRPQPTGPVVKPLWHNATIRVEHTPLIHQGKVFVMAQPWADRDFPRVYAFDVRTGRALWNTEYATRRIVAVVGQSLVIQDSGGRTQFLDQNTGKGTSVPWRFSATQMIERGGVLYTIGVTGAVEAWPLPLEQPRWSARMEPHPLGHSDDKLKQQWAYKTPYLPPVLAGGAVYTSGQSKYDLETRTPAYVSVHAFDAASGRERWKWEMEDRPEVLSLHGIAADEHAAYIWLYDRAKVFTHETLIVLDAATGKEKWRRESPTYPAAFPHALLLGDAVLTCEYPGSPEGRADKAGLLFLGLDRADGHLLWQSKTAWKYPSAVIEGDVLAVSDAKVHQVLTENNNTSPDSFVSVVSIRTGKELWRSNEVELGVFTAPAAGDGMLAVGSKPFRFNQVEGKREVAGLYAWRLHSE